MLRGSSKRVRCVGAVAVVLGVQIAVTYQLDSVQQTPVAGRPALAEIPSEIGAWRTVQELPLASAAVEMLSPDDIVSRLYRAPDSDTTIELFTTYYKSQISDKNAHSPKVCLPSSGWVPVDSKTVEVPIPALGGKPISVNYYVIAKGEAKALVLYWYQTHNDVVPGEYTLKLHRVANAIRDGRTDMLFVRVLTPLTNNEDALRRLEGFIQRLYPQLLPQFGSSRA